MIRKRTFTLKSLHDDSSWKTFAEMYQYMVNSKKKIEETFSQAVFDQNFNEPMNSIVLECDEKNPQVQQIHEYANKLNELFADHSDKIVIDTYIHEIPRRYRDRVYVSHTWFVKEAI